MDAVDYQIIEYLLEDGRRPYAQIASQIGVSTGTVHQRVKRLKERGYINSFTINLNWEAMGYPVDAFVSIRDNKSRGLEELSERLSIIPYIRSSAAVTGEFDLLLHIKARSSNHLGELLDEILTIINLGRQLRAAYDGVIDLVTLSTYSDGRVPPLPAEDKA